MNKAQTTFQATGISSINTNVEETQSLLEESSVNDKCSRKNVHVNAV